MASSSGSGSGQPGRRTTRVSWLPTVPSFVERSFEWLDNSLSKLTDNQVADNAATLAQRMQANELERNRVLQDAGINIQQTPTIPAPMHNSTAINQAPTSQPAFTPAEETPVRRMNVTQPSPLFNDSLLNSTSVVNDALQDTMNVYNTGMEKIREVISQDEEEQENYRQSKKLKDQEERRQNANNLQKQGVANLSPILEQSEHSGIQTTQQNDSEQSQSEAAGLDTTALNHTPVTRKHGDSATRDQPRRKQHRLPSEGLYTFSKRSSSVHHGYTSDEQSENSEARRQRARRERRKNIGYQRHQNTESGVDETDNDKNREMKQELKKLQKEIREKEESFKAQMLAQEELYRKNLKKKQRECDEALIDATHLIKSQVETEREKDLVISESKANTSDLILALQKQNMLIRQENKEQRQRELEKEQRDREEARKVKAEEVALAKHMKELELEERRKEREQQMKEQEQKLAFQHEEFKSMMEAQSQSLSQTLKEAGKNTSFNNSSLNISAKGSKWIRNVKSNPPMPCQEDENIIVYLRTKFERHVSNNFHTREEQVMAFGMMYKKKPARCDGIKAIAERMLPENPLNEGDRLRVYRAIADKYNTTESTTIEKLKPGEDLDDLWKRARIIEEEQSPDTMPEGRALKKLNSSVLAKLLDPERNLMSSELRISLKQAVSICVGMGWRRTGIDDGAIEDLLSEMIYEKAYIQKEKKSVLQVQKEESPKSKSNVVNNVESDVQFGAQDIRLKSNQNVTASQEKSQAVNYSQGQYSNRQSQGQRQGGYQKRAPQFKFNTKVNIETNSANKYGYVAQEGSGCFSCNRPGHGINNCPFRGACRKCLKELGTDGKFLNDPWKVTFYRSCTKPGHGLSALHNGNGYGTQAAAPQGATGQSTSTTQQSSNNNFNVTTDLFYHNHTIPDGELAFQNLGYQEFGQRKNHRVYVSHNEFGRKYHFAELNIENHTGKTSRATFLLDTGCDADLVMSMRAALSYGYASDITESKNSAVVTVANSQKAVCRIIQVPVIYLGQSLLLDAIIMPECPNNLLGTGALRKMMLDDGTMANDTLHALCREISQSSELKNQQ